MTSPLEGRASSGSATTQTITAIDGTWSSPQVNSTGHNAEVLLDPAPGTLGAASDGSEARIATSAGQFRLVGNALEFPRGQQLRGEQLGDGCTELVTLDHQSGGAPAEGTILFWSQGEWHALSAGAVGQELTIGSSGDPAWSDQPLDPDTSGTVTSVALAGPTGTTVSGSPVTSAGTLTLSWASQSANTVLAAPDGSSGVPTFRVLAAGDIPALPASQITSGQLAAARGGTGLDGSATSNGQLLIGNGSGYSLATITAGSGVAVVNSSGGISISATGSGGTVTSVALSLPGIFSLSGSPITTSGTLSVSLQAQSANTVFAGPSSGSAAAPAFRALAPADLPAAASAGGHIHAHSHFL